MRNVRFVSLLVLFALLLASCAPAATAAPTVASTVAPTVAPTAAPSPTAAPVVPTPVAQISPDLLAQKTHLLICSDFPYPPQEFFDENGNPQGLDVDMGIEIAARLGLKPQFVNSVFDTIIAAVTSGKCDIIISAQNITADRQKQVSMIPYFKAGQSCVVAKGNPNKISVAMDLCGKSAAAESGTTETDHLQGTGDYKDNGIVQQCEKAGQKAPDVVVTQKDSDALQQLQANKVAVYFTDSPVAAYYTVQHPDLFEIAGQPLDAVAEGISVPCGQADCTGAALSPVGQAVQAALKSMMADGAYLKILQKWNLASGSVQ
jgi:polar amino acid transport system substrate-binding protein